MTDLGDSSPKGRVSAPPRRRFTLSGPSVALNPATNALRADLADMALADQVFAPHYAAAVAYRCLSSEDVYSAPSSDAPVVCHIKPDDNFSVLDVSGGWAWGKCTSGQVGYVRASSVSPHLAA